MQWLRAVGSLSLPLGHLHYRVTGQDAIQEIEKWAESAALTSAAHSSHFSVSCMASCPVVLYNLVYYYIPECHLGYHSTLEGANCEEPIHHKPGEL